MVGEMVSGSIAIGSLSVPTYNVDTVIATIANFPAGLWDFYAIVAPRTANAVTPCMFNGQITGGSGVGDVKSNITTTPADAITSATTPNSVFVTMNGLVRSDGTKNVNLKVGYFSGTNPGTFSYSAGVSWYAVRRA
jgi:hypothetical protein